MNYKIKGIVAKPAECKELGGKKKFELLIDSAFDKYPNHIPFAVWRKGDDTKDIERLQPGDIVEIEFYIKSREWNGRHYTELTAVRIDTQNDGTENHLKESGNTLF